MFIVKCEQSRHPSCWTLLHITKIVKIFYIQSVFYPSSIINFLHFYIKSQNLFDLNGCHSQDKENSNLIVWQYFKKDYVYEKCHYSNNCSAISGLSQVQIIKTSYYGKHFSLRCNFVRTARVKINYKKTWKTETNDLKK